MHLRIQIQNQTAVQRIRRIQIITIIWMCFEAALSLWAAWLARSPALAAFGGDSAVELFSAVVVLWRFRTHASEGSERIAARVAGGLLFVLAAYVLVASTMSLTGYIEPQTSRLGVAVLLIAALLMPWLASEKRRLSVLTGSAALRADAAESALCAYLSVIALIGLLVHAIWHITSADPVAALLITPLIVYEGREAMRGKPCGCC